jgi:LDH2 family malate/lactate/ureidoglycolate dehydrogenase
MTSAPLANAPLAIGAATLTHSVAAIFAAAGVEPADAAIAAEDLVAADIDGVASHGVMLVPMYLDRLLNGSVSTASCGGIVWDKGGAIVVDAANALGQLTARQAVKLAVTRAKDLGLATVTVRNAFHFGTAGRYARMMAAEGCVGIVMSNTRPLMPAAGGAEALVGNNPLAIALPTRGPFAAEVDLALSASAMGKIRLAAAAQQSIPEGWAADADGRPTTDPNAAIKGMLLPAAGPKGFGIAFMVDLLCGGLSGGAIGAEVQPLYGDAAVPYRCSQLFLAINTEHFPTGKEFAARTESQVARISASKRAPGTDRIYAPGELAYSIRDKNAGSCRISRETARSLVDAAAKVGVVLDTELKIKTE